MSHFSREAGGLGSARSAVGRSGVLRVRCRTRQVGSFGNWEVLHAAGGFYVGND